MKIDPRLFLYTRILLVCLLIGVLGLGPVPHAVSALSKAARQALDSGDWSTAATSLATIAEYYPWRTELKIDAARAAFQAGDAKGTIEYLERAGASGQLSTADLILLGDAFYNYGEIAKAEATWKNLSEREDSYQALTRLAALYLEQKDYAAAASEMQRMLSLNPADVALYYRVGLLYAISDPIKALPYFAQAEGLDPANATNARALYDKIRTASLFDQPAYNLLATGRELGDLGEWVLAAEALRHAAELDPSYSDAWAFLGEAEQQISLQQTGSNHDVGLAELQRALQLDGNSVLANTFMALYWERQQEYAQAQHYLDQAIANSPDDPYLYTELGNILSRAGDLPAAQSAFEKAIALAPQDPLFYRLKAEFALENEIQIRELALPAARQALMLKPQDAESLDLMAKVMIELQDYHSAENYAQAAIEADPGFTPAYLHLGTAYLYLGESDLARKYLDMAVNQDPGSWASLQATRMIDYYFP